MNRILWPSLVLSATALAAGLTRDELERLAVERNPAVARAQAMITAAEGRQRQAGAYPNPVVGLNADEVNGGPTIRYGEWGGFASQQIVTGGKRGLDRGIAGQEVAATKAMSKAERQRIVNAALMLFYQALADQRLLDVRTELRRLPATPRRSRVNCQRRPSRLARCSGGRGGGTAR